MPFSLLTIKPLIENVDPFLLYQDSTPDTFSLQENPILYGGGRGWTLRPLANAVPYFERFLAQNGAKNELSDELEVDVFVLNTAFVLWFTQHSFGASIPYQKIILHALQKTPEGALLLYLQIQDESSEENLIDFVIAPKRTFVPDPKERLFTKRHFGAFISADRIVETTFTALSRCSALHYDPESENEEEAVFDDVGEVHVDTVGQADDIYDDGPQGGMSSGVEVSINESNDNVRQREADEEDISKGKQRKVHR